ncbi:MAG: hypothetical protein A2X28_09110 [Elusimicrobia bacterium GWA2_56_46]|nr:MAG: hypothetical protein A2X28_09110 [Elusimicrobia bacterium GWA2_56_46]OGR54462.1 MAG: hypothetical protein A2X39_04190 [Elusimicrobia bacterium GWC2_56_31]HBB67440.1 hypothetical protein [Elusimicrobiota bacterium]HBW22558.1 hypothetical protein [Elusimicrobiota bacterium]
MKKLRILLTVCLLAEQFAAPAALLFAQETQLPDSDKDFTADLQGPSSEEGGPILEQPSGQDNALPRSIPRGRTPGTPLEPVQIGGAPREVSMYEETETVSPLDRKIGPIHLKGAPLSSFMEIISAQSKVSFIVAEGLESKTITVYLRKTTVREALELLLSIRGLTYQRIGKTSTYVVRKRSAGTPNLITKIFVLNYIPLIRIGSVGEDIASITSQDVSSSGMSAETQGGAGAARPQGDEKGIAILSVIKSVLSKNGMLVTDPRTNTLIVTDVPEVFPQVEQIISELDKKAPQILIEAQIMEINTDRLNELGIEWGGSRGEMAYFAGPARLTDYGLRPGFFSGDQWKNFFPKTTDTSATSASGGSTSGGVDSVFATGQQSAKGVYYGIFSLAQLQAIFRALISRGEAHYLGKPKIVAMNNMTSLISISRDAAVGTGSSVSSAGGATGSVSTSVERRRVGLVLKVTPQVNREGYITMVIQPNYSDVVASGVAVQGQTILDPVSRGVSTMVRVKNGQPVVIGGMLSSIETKSVKKVPLLGYIPIIGWLFTSVSSRRTNTDLVIFVTPTILVD